MAATKKVLRSYLNRIIHIRRALAPALVKEVNDLALRFEPGTYRSSEHPGIKIAIKRSQAGGYNTSWKAVLEELRYTIDIPQSLVSRLARKHRHFAYPSKTVSVSVQVDKAAHPKKSTIL